MRYVPSVKKIILCAFVVLSLAQLRSVTAAEPKPKQPFPGISFWSEVRQNPPERLFIATVDLSNPKLHVRVAPGGSDPDGPGKWQTTLMRPTEVAARERFDLVINGDFFDARGVKDTEGTNALFRGAIWSKVIGPAVTDGKVWSMSAEKKPCLVVSKTGKVGIELRDRPAPDDWQVIAGNTMLVENGIEVAHQSITRHPRTVLGLNAAGTKLVIIVVDGRKRDVAVGMSYKELAAEMLRLGCHRALNLDGGGSSVLAIRDSATGRLQILNEPTDGHERAVANVLGVSVDTK